MTTYFFIVSFVLSITGLSICGYIAKKKSKNHPLVCPIGSSCDEVVYSKYSKTFGLRNELGELMYYALSAVFYGLLLFNIPIYPSIIALVLIANLCAFTFSIYLINIMAFVIKKWCTWCIASALISSALFVISFHSFLKY